MILSISDWICNVRQPRASSSCASLVSPPSSSMAVKHGNYLLILNKKDPGLRNQVPEETSPHLLLGAQDQWLGAEQDQLPCGARGTSADNCQETESCMFRACHSPRHPSITIPQGTLEDGRRRGRQSKCWTDTIKAWTSLPMPELLTRASCRKVLEGNLCWIVGHVASTTQLVKGLVWTELNTPALMFKGQLWQSTKIQELWFSSFTLALMVGG